MPHVTNRRCASVKALMEIKDVTREDALRIRHVWRTINERHYAARAIDAILRTHGVEYLGRHKRSHESVSYCNAGDTYATTVVFVGPVMHVGCWGDLVERNLIEEFK
jgi:hypothetical protein